MPRVDKSKSLQEPSNEIRLIELIRENPELYDAGHPNAKDNNQKRIIWEYISEEMNTPGEYFIEHRQRVPIKRIQ